MNPAQDQQNRLYAVNLLNRAVNAWDARDVGIVAAVIAELESDVAGWLDGDARGAWWREQIALAVRDGRHRPELPQPHPASASLESNLK